MAQPGGMAAWDQYLSAEDRETIERRLDAVGVLVNDGLGRDRVREALDGVRDMERLAGRAAAGRANPREMAALRDSFTQLPDVLESLSALAGAADSAALATAEADLDPLTDLSQSLSAALEDRPPVNLADGGVIRAGHDAELD